MCSHLFQNYVKVLLLLIFIINFYMFVLLDASMFVLFSNIFIRYKINVKV